MLKFGGNRMLLSAPMGVLPGSPGTGEGTSRVLLGGQERARGHIPRALLASPLQPALFGLLEVILVTCWHFSPSDLLLRLLRRRMGLVAQAEQKEGGKVCSRQPN